MNNNICIFGDSIVWGAYDPKNAGWATMLRNYYEKKDGRNVYSLGICGDTTEELLKRIEIEVSARREEIGMVVFSIGTNDSQFLKQEKRNKTLLKNFEKNLEKLSDISKKFTNKIAFIGLLGVDDSLVGTNSYDEDHLYKSEFVKIYNDALKEFCGRKDVPFLNLFDFLDKKDDFYDGLHPNSMGHEKLFNKIRDFIENL